MAQYRIVHYIPDVILQGRIPVAALVKDDMDRVTVIKLKLWDTGRGIDAAMCGMILGTLYGMGYNLSWEPSISPQVAVTEPRQIPEGVSPFQWVDRNIVNR